MANESDPAVHQNAKWINPSLYPYQTKSFVVDAGTMIYVDEGQGSPIVMVHGNPAWSFVYRKLIDGLREHYRCIAPDHIGFGQSDKPYDWSYIPQDHAANLDQLLESLDLQDITLVVQDWGGPIGLSYAIAHPERIKNLIILNTWMWSVRDDWYYRMFSGFVGGAIGRFLCRHFNFFVNSVMSVAYGERSKLTLENHRHYRDALPTPENRKGTWVFPKHIIAASEWLDALWNQREKLANKHVMLAWGMKDIAFREKELNRWQSVFPEAAVHRFETAGHFVQDEAGDEIAEMMREMLED